MLPSLGFSEILVLAILALIVVGPKDLPLMLRKLGRFMARMRAMANEFRTGFDELARQAELDELRREVEALRRVNPISEIRNEVTSALPAPDASPIVEAEDSFAFLEEDEAERDTRPRPAAATTPAPPAPAPAPAPETPAPEVAPATARSAS